MTQEEKRIKIAEACGWKIDTSISGPIQQWKHPMCARWQDDPPDYFNDLNAMHEAEKIMNPKQWLSYWSFLGLELKDTSILHATAQQRAEAFGLTLGIWES